MKLFSRFFGRPEAKASAAGAAIAATTAGQPAWAPRDYASVARDAFARNVVAFRCVSEIARGCASVPWLLFDADGAELDRHPLLDLLNRPNPMQGRGSFIEAVVASWLISGNAFVEAVPAGDRVAELWSLRPDRMKVVPSDSGVPAAYEYQVNGQTVRYDVDPANGRSAVLHLREYNPLNDFYGQAPAEAAGYSIDQHNNLMRHGNALLTNGARPSGALVFKPTTDPLSKQVYTVSDQDIDKIAAKLKELHQGPAMAGVPFVFAGDVTWKEMSLSPKELDFLASKDSAAVDIAASFQVPHILIVPTQSTYNNLRDARISLWENTIIPRLDRLVEELNRWLSPQFGEGLRLFYDLDQVSALFPRRMQKYQLMIQAFASGIITREEARVALDYEPVPSLGTLPAPKE